MGGALAVWWRRRILLGAAVVAATLFAPAAPALAQSFNAAGSAEQVYVTGAPPSTAMALTDGSGRTVQTKTTNALGGLLFRGVRPGAGYRVRLASTGEQSPAITVHSNAAAPWDPNVYNQSIPDNGYGYLTTRDGTQLAINVHPPTSPAGEPGLPPGISLPTTPAGAPFTPPYPTLIEYSGYGYANPDGPTNGIAVIANLMGFAVVDVNMRGSGCSGGAFDFFEPLQNLDGYDVIETIARQPWVLNHKVGMMGISYGGISQLFTAQLDPPSLAAISPLSVIDATATTLYPGGILNTGFAVQWAKERQDEAKPAGPNSGQPWAYKRIQQGDQTCKANQALHPEAADLMAKIRANAHYNPKVADPLDPVTFVKKITVPTFMACQWEDEQTGGHCPALVRHFTGTSRKWFMFTNGVHVDSLDPQTFNRWYDFLQLYVAHRAPLENAALVQASAPAIYQAALGVKDVITLPPDPIQAMPSYDAALAAFEQQPPVRVLFDNGAGSSLTANTPGDPYPTFERSFAGLPVPGTVARHWYLSRAGALAAHPPARGGANWYRSDAKALPLTDFTGSTDSGGLWSNAPDWKWDWRQNPAGTAVSYVSAPLSADTTVIGAGAVRLWARSSTPNVDLQATISEVRPDGKETFVQNGWLRANERKLATGEDNLLAQRSTALEPVLSMRARDVRAMPRGRFVKLVIPLYYQGHVYRAGSRIRVTIAAPNGTQPIWSFSETAPKRTAAVTIAFSRKMPSSVVLPVVPGVADAGRMPPCPSLRNEPCRAYAAIANRTAAYPTQRRAATKHRSPPRRRAPAFTG